jgi:hypothetical protein
MAPTPSNAITLTMTIDQSRELIEIFMDSPISSQAGQTESLTAKLIGL